MESEKMHQGIIHNVDGFIVLIDFNATLIF